MLLLAAPLALASPVHLAHERALLGPARRPPAPPPAAGTRSHVVYGYLPYWTLDPADVAWEHLTHLAVFSVGLESDGSLSSLSRWTGTAAEAVALGHAAGVRVHLCVTSFDGDVMAAVLGSESRRAVAIDAMAAQVEAYGADGVNLDFEGLPSGNRDDLVQFVRDLRARVGEVWLATPAVDWSGAWDYSALTEASDGLFIMGYAYHWTGGGAGPNAPLAAGDTWSQWSLSWTADDYLSSGADPDRVVLGLPLYGQTWPVADSAEVPADTTGDGWSIVYTDAVEEAARAGRSYDAASDTPWYGGGGEQTWYDDEPSLTVKMRWAVEDAGLAGIGFWALGYDGNDPAFWESVDAITMSAEPVEDTGDDTDTDTDTDARDPRPAAGRVVDSPGGCATAPAGAGLAWLGLAFIRRRRR